MVWSLFCDNPIKTPTILERWRVDEAYSRVWILNVDALAIPKNQGLTYVFSPTGNCINSKYV